MNTHTSMILGWCCETTIQRIMLPLLAVEVRYFAARSLGFHLP